MISCDKLIGLEYINKFTNVITNKWPLLFFTPNSDPYTVLLTINILSRLCISQGTNYINKLRSTSEGYLVLHKLLSVY